jgi:hypothetical protein
MRSAFCWLLVSCTATAACMAEVPKPATVVVVVEQGRSAVDRQAAAAVERKAKEKEDRENELYPGTSITFGTGITRAALGDSPSVSDLGIAWTGRIVVGTKRWMGVEGAYLGSLRAVSSQAVGGDAGLMQNGLETLLRMNLGTMDFQPYAVAGLGWSRCALVTSGGDMVTDTRDDVVTMPIGVGVTVYLGRHNGSGSTLDFRLMYQTVLDEDFPEMMQLHDLDQWMASIQAGWEL